MLVTYMYHLQTKSCTGHSPCTLSAAGLNIIADSTWLHFTKLLLIPVLVEKIARKLNTAYLRLITFCAMKLYF